MQGAGSLQAIAKDGVTVVQNPPYEMNVGPVVFEATGIVVAGIGAFSAVIGSLLGYLASKKAGSIVIKGSNGRSIEIPRDTPLEKVGFYVEQARAIDADKVDLRIT